MNLDDLKLDPKIESIFRKVEEELPKLEDLEDNFKETDNSLILNEIDTKLDNLQEYVLGEVDKLKEEGYCANLISKQFEKGWTYIIAKYFME